ncbi:hypothetical protein COY28_06860, partial [Candidatus Woesearchaeota archaeon CG_4_10_14_0_2_um_filter_57_5]
MMETGEQIGLFKEFFEQQYSLDLAEIQRLGKRRMSVDFGAIATHSVELAEMLMDQPEEVIKAAELAIQEVLGLDEPVVAVRLINVPYTQKYMVRSVRAEHIGRLIYLEGII